MSTPAPDTHVRRRLLLVAAATAIAVAALATWALMASGGGAHGAKARSGQVAEVVGSADDRAKFAAYTADVLRFQLGAVGPLDAAQARQIASESLCPANFSNRLVRFTTQYGQGGDFIHELQSDMLLVAHFCPDAYAGYVADADRFDFAGADAQAGLNPGTTLDREMRAQGWSAPPLIVPPVLPTIEPSTPSSSDIHDFQSCELFMAEDVSRLVGNHYDAEQQGVPFDDASLYGRGGVQAEKRAYARYKVLLRTSGGDAGDSLYRDRVAADHHDELVGFACEAYGVGD